MSFADFHFIRPYCLLAYLPAIALFIALLKNKLNRGNWSSICDPALLPFVIQDRDVTHSHWSLSLGSIATLLIIFALAGPTWERLPSPVFRNDAALVIALDLSRSMDASDIKPSRLSKARYKITDILNQRKDGQTALLVYAGDVFIVTPLTEDNETIVSQISALTTQIMPSQGSDTGLAIKKAVALLKQSGLQKGDILLVTDDIDFENTIDTVQALNGYRLSILGVGTKEGAPIKDSQGGFVKDSTGNIVVPRLNNAILSKLASEGNGFYTPVNNDDSDINALLNQFEDPLDNKGTEGSENNNLFINQWSEKGPWLLLLILPFAAFSFRKGLLSLTLLFLLPFPEPSYALEWKDLWTTQNQQAQQAFKQQKYQQAAKQYENPQWKAAAQYKSGQFEQTIETLKDDQSAQGLYNKGNALAQAGQLKEAIEAYDKTLEINPENVDAKHNKEQVKKEIEKQQQQQQEQEQEQEQENNQQESDSDPEKSDKNNKDQPSDNNEQSDDQQTEDPNKNPENNDQQQDNQQQPENESNTEQPEQAQADEQEASKEEAEKPEAEKMSESSDYDESEQANEQWLKRIPDDPAGLLKRKFKYQYNQRKHKPSNQQSW